jgi:phosphatidylinositol alpha-1,6-mannosyltransferase
MAPRLRARAGVGRLVATTHGHEVWWAALPGTRDALRRIGEGVDTVTYLTDYTARRIAPRLSPAARARMARLSPGVDGPGFGRRAAPPAPAEARAAFGLGDGPLVLCVSRLVPRKGQDRLIEGWPSVVAAHPKARLVIAGSGPYEARLRAMVAASRAPAGSIVMTGRVGDRQLPGLYGAASVFAMPCRSGLRGLDVEGLGIVFLEAQAAGVPVVAGRSGGAPDAVLEGETGFVVDGRTPGPAAARIVELLDGPARATAMGAAGRDWVGREWDWQSRYESLARLLRP